MKLFYSRLLFVSLLLFGAQRASLAQTYSEEDLQKKIKEATAAARQKLTDSLAKATKAEQETTKKVKEAVTAALTAQDNSTHSDAKIGTVSLVPKARYTLFTGVPAKPIAGQYFTLKEMNFYMENGRLLRVYATGELGLDSVYKQRVNPAATATAKAEVKKAQNARAEEKRVLLAAGAARTAARQATTSTQEKQRLSGEAAAYENKARQYGKLALLADSTARVAAKDSVTINLPASASDGPGIVTRHAYRTLRPVRFTNGTTIININQGATDKGLDLLIPDEYTESGATPCLRFLDLVNVVQTTGRRLITDNDKWTLTPGGTTSHDLKAGASLGGLLEVALYTDLLAALDNEDNGLVTTEVSSLLPLNNRSLCQNSQFMVFTAVRPFVTLTRLDSKFDTLRLRAGNTVDRPDLLQRSYLRFGVNMNLLTFDNRRHVSYHLNGSWTRTLSQVAGSSGRDTTSIRNVYQNMYGLELLTTIRRQRNFGADLYFTAYLHNVQSRRLITNTGSQWAMRPGALFYYHPFGSPTNKLFFRVSNFIFPKGRQRDFVQLQLGYSIGLGSLLQGQSATQTEPGSNGAHLPSPQ
ncbi:hypothetical protein LGH70_20885 [Hymenobacter sp. BT635]|uniref:Uncharacterized protein n=1 Tax=Hymenobacter nitidus TaxID=2880929 RepID=A0ABS8AI05_9BACT|nr:hypothetical protein [Hymenobacter nitidus]MCB2380063.1 hypothetical protein [Hymenobacter nitidus]